MTNLDSKKLTISKVPIIDKSRSIMIAKRQEIKELVESPLIDACKIFWDKNIRTLETSANEKDTQTGHAYIGIDFNNLSQENRKIAKRYGDTHDDLGSTVLRILIPVNESISITEISEKAVQIANAFQKQVATWITPITIESTLSDYKKNYGAKHPKAVAQEEARLRQPNAWEKHCKKLGYYFDPKTQTAYMSKEHYEKINKKD
jgi:hypothetical protein